jgi:hypothetical protein
MKLENIKLANRIVDRIKKLNEAKEKVETILNAFDGDSDGTSSLGAQLLYGFHIGEYKDNSGKNHIDLTGCMLGMSVLRDLESKINAQLLSDHALLETL